MQMTARLALQDGSIWRGLGFGASGTQVGEVVFNTSMTGYQEILTDPSYAGQMVVMTAPQIGNTGINPEDHESRRAWMHGFIVREISPVVSNWRAQSTLSNWLAEQGLIGIGEIDTRALTRRLRDQGSQKGALSTDETLSDHALIEQARVWSGLDDIDMVRQVTCAEMYHWHEPVDASWIHTEHQSHREMHVVAFDYGIKYNILRRLKAHNCRVTVVPATTPAEEVLALKPDGVFLSNGPGDPAAVTYAAQSTRDLLGKVPILGICLGHQILGLAYGGQTYRLKFGHHGGNQPVKVAPDGHVEISAHNHNYAVELESLPADVEVTHINLNDGCCEGMRHRSLPAISVQYHPEASPGPHDADPIFGDFMQLMLEFSPQPISK